MVRLEIIFVYRDNSTSNMNKIINLKKLTSVNYVTTLNEIWQVLRNTLEKEIKFVSEIMHTRLPLKNLTLTLVLFQFL